MPDLYHAYLIGEWILMRFPQDETLKLSGQWHGLYRITALTPTDVTAKCTTPKKVLYKCT